MSRSGYSEDYDGDVPIDLYRQAVENATLGKRGQSFFKALVEALDAMPDKRLIVNDLQDKRGEVCAIGALGLARHIDMTKMDPENARHVGKAFNIAESLAREVVYENDERGDHYAPGYGMFRETPEQRWVRMRAWAASQIKADPIRHDMHVDGVVR